MSIICYFLDNDESLPSHCYNWKNWHELTMAWWQAVQQQFLQPGAGTRKIVQHALGGKDSMHWQAIGQIADQSGTQGLVTWSEHMLCRFLPILAQSCTLVLYITRLENIQKPRDIRQIEWRHWVLESNTVVFSLLPSHLVTLHSIFPQCLDVAFHLHHERKPKSSTFILRLLSIPGRFKEQPVSAQEAPFLSSAHGCKVRNWVPGIATWVWQTLTN